MAEIVGKQDRSTPLSLTYDTLGLHASAIPKHVAIIMDGNGRWAQQKKMPRTKGHIAGAESLRRAIKACVELDIRYLSVYTFSTENWKRPEDEVSFLMALVREMIIKEIPALNKEGARVRALGHIEGMPKDVQKGLIKAEMDTRDNTVLQFNLMLNYGSRFEILEAAKRAAKSLNAEQMDALTEEDFSSYMYTQGMPDPDVLIRTGGDFRISNFMLWQVSYSELFFLDVLWPDFSREHLIDVVKQFQMRQRRFGGVLV